MAVAFIYSTSSLLACLHGARQGAGCELIEWIMEVLTCLLTLHLAEAQVQWGRKIGVDETEH